MNRVSSSKLLLAAGLAAFAAAACQTVATAQAPAAPPAAPAWKAKNLQVLPADMPRQQLIGVMKGFTVALGVECSFCHANGADGKLDPASDAKTEKSTARWMMKMVATLNKDMGVTDLSQAKVTCYTCHRGSPHPLTAPPPADAPQAAPHTH